MGDKLHILHKKATVLLSHSSKFPVPQPSSGWWLTQGSLFSGEVLDSKCAYQMDQGCRSTGSHTPQPHGLPWQWSLYQPQALTAGSSQSRWLKPTNCLRDPQATRQVRLWSKTNGEDSLSHREAEGVSCAHIPDQSRASLLPRAHLM